MDALEASRTEARGSAEALGMERKAAAALREALVSENESSRLQHSSLRTDFGEVRRPRACAPHACLTRACAARSLPDEREL